MNEKIPGSKDINLSDIISIIKHKIYEDITCYYPSFNIKTDDINLIFTVKIIYILFTLSLFIYGIYLLFLEYKWQYIIKNQKYNE